MPFPVFIFIISFLSGLAGAWIVGRFALLLGLVDLPSERSSHTRPTPKGGGIGILLAFVISCMVLGISPSFYIPPAFLAFFSFAGDRRDISPSVRLAAQFMAAFALLYGLRDQLFFLQNSNLLFIIAMVASIFITGTANFYNFMDGINGIAAMTGIVAFSLLGVFCLQNGCQDETMTLVCFGIACACAGFLPFNIPGAKVFMGDVGSILLGFVFAATVLVAARDWPQFFLLSGFLFPFYGDELVTMYERIRNGQKLTLPHRRHLYQVLANEAGIAHWKVSVGYGIFQIIASLCFWSAWKTGVFWLVSTMLFIGILFITVNNVVKSRYFCG